VSVPTERELLPLGTNGYFPSEGRQTMCFLLSAPGAALLLDAGSGAARLGESPARERLAAVERVDLLLSHYHLDHVIGISYLPALLAGKRLRIFAPASPLTQAGSEALDRLIGPPLFPVPLHRWPLPVEVVPYSGPELEIGPFRVRVRAQRHPGGSVGFRIDDSLAYVTDTILDLRTIELARGVGTLLHEVWLDDEEAARTDPHTTGHSSVTPVAELAKAAGVGRLVPMHHHPRRTAEELEMIAERLRSVAGCPVELPVEGQPIPLG
jgi:ribonuclease BN (tRNA processing enzyme)